MSSKSRCPVLIDLEQSSYKPPPDQDITKYIKAAFTLYKQGEELYSRGDDNITYKCYFGFCKLVRDHILNHEHSKANRYAEHVDLLRAHTLEALNRLDILAKRIEDRYEASKINPQSLVVDQHGEVDFSKSLLSPPKHAPGAARSAVSGSQAPSQLQSQQQQQQQPYARRGSSQTSTMHGAETMAGGGSNAIPQPRSSTTTLNQSTSTFLSSPPNGDGDDDDDDSIANRLSRLNINQQATTTATMNPNQARSSINPTAVAGQQQQRIGRRPLSSSFTPVAPGHAESSGAESSSAMSSTRVHLDPRTDMSSSTSNASSLSQLHRMRTNRSPSPSVPLSSHGQQQQQQQQPRYYGESTTSASSTTATMQSPGGNPYDSLLSRQTALQTATSNRSSTREFMNGERSSTTIATTSHNGTKLTGISQAAGPGTMGLPSTSSTTATTATTANAQVQPSPYFVPPTTLFSTITPPPPLTSQTSVDSFNSYIPTSSPLAIDLPPSRSQDWPYAQGRPPSASSSRPQPPGASNGQFLGDMPQQSYHHQDRMTSNNTLVDPPYSSQYGEYPPQQYPLQQHPSQQQYPPQQQYQQHQQQQGPNPRPSDSVMPFSNHLPKEEPRYARVKPIHLPTSLIRCFLSEASSDLARNVETAALLLGHEQNGEYYIQCMVFPEQEGCSDRVTTLKEERIIDVVFSRGLVIVGWIHTHPTQTAFLSSIDLHCQASYQSAIPESIAIVCAPKFNTNAIFALSIQGLEALKKCGKESDKFHGHDPSIPFFGNAEHVITHYDPTNSQFLPHLSNHFVPPSSSRSVGLPFFTPNMEEQGNSSHPIFTSLRRYECEVVDLRRGEGKDILYIYPPRHPNDLGPSGGKGVQEYRASLPPDRQHNSHHHHHEHHEHQNDYHQYSNQADNRHQVHQSSQYPSSHNNPIGNEPYHQQQQQPYHHQQQQQPQQLPHPQYPPQNSSQQYHQPQEHRYTHQQSQQYQHQPQQQHQQQHQQQTRYPNPNSFSSSAAPAPLSTPASNTYITTGTGYPSTYAPAPSNNQRYPTTSYSVQQQHAPPQGSQPYSQPPYPYPPPASR